MTDQTQRLTAIPEWVSQACTWMAWPSRPDTFGGEDALATARDTVGSVARAIAEFQPVRMLCPPDQMAPVSLALGQGIAVVPMAIDDLWVRDTGPTFVADQTGALAGVTWRFNGWGGLVSDFARDAQVAETLCERLTIPAHPVPMVCEGGAIAFDGAGLVVATEECLLHDGRFVGVARPEIEALLMEKLGAERVIWLPKGYEEDETVGHVDEILVFHGPGQALLNWTENTDDPNREIMAAARSILEEAGVSVTLLPQPARRDRADGQRLTLSYTNIAILNGAVLAPSFDDPCDGPALDVLKGAFPDREIIRVPALPIVRGGGGFHCITLGQPQVEGTD